MYFCDIESREVREVAPGVRMRTFWGDQMLLSIVELDPDAVVPMHSHPHEQCGTVISGALTLTINGETRTLKSGDAYIVPGEVEHTAQAGPTATKVIDIFSPVREAYQY